MTREIEAPEAHSDPELRTRAMGSSIPPKSIAEYRARAGRCLLAARRATDLWVRTELISLAAHWARLAELAESTVYVDEVYERTAHGKASQ